MAEPEYAVLFDQLFVLDDVIEHAGGTAPSVILCHRDGKGAGTNESRMKSGPATGIGIGEIRYVSQADWRLGKCEYKRRTHVQELQRMESTRGGDDSKSVEGKRADASVSSSINARSAPERKIQLFRSLFRGRDDVYAHGFVSQKTGKVGYAFDDLHTEAVWGGHYRENTQSGRVMTKCGLTVVTESQHDYYPLIDRYHDDVFRIITADGWRNGAPE